MRYKSFSLNSDYFASLTSDLEKAKEKIYIETYIYRDDELGQRIRDILTKKAGQGLDVKLLIDAIGSIASSEINFTDLILAGGDVRFFRRLLLLPFHLAKLNNRNHRKIAVIDKDISYVGSSNIDAATSSWREFNLRIEDSEFNRIFFEIFIQQFLISNSLTLNKKISRKILKHNEVEILRSVPFLKNPIRDAIMKLILGAKKDILIENPYLIFNKKMLGCLRWAVRKKVKITFMLPTRADINLVDILNKRYMKKARKMGAKILLYPKMLHSKIIFVDGKKWMFGSANMEYRSIFTQFEIMLKGEGGKIGEFIAKHLDEGVKDIEKRGREFDGKITPKERIVGNLLYLVRFLF